MSWCGGVGSLILHFLWFQVICCLPTKCARSRAILVPSITFPPVTAYVQSCSSLEDRQRAFVVFFRTTLNVCDRMSTGGCLHTSTFPVSALSNRASGLENILADITDVFRYDTSLSRFVTPLIFFVSSPKVRS